MISGTTDPLRRLDNGSVSAKRFTLSWAESRFKLARLRPLNENRSPMVTSLPVLMDFAESHNLDPAWIGMIWSFSSGGKSLAYQSAVLVLG